MGSGQVMTSDRVACFSTEDFGPRDRFEAWRDELRARFGAADVLPAERGAFHATIDTTALGEFAMSSVASEPMTFERSTRHVARAEHDGFTAGLLLQGRAVVEHAEREAAIGPGDLVLCDSRRPLRIRFDEPFRQVVFSCERAQLESHLPDAGQRLARRIEGQAALSAMANYIAATTLAFGPSCVSHAVVRHALEVLALALGGFPARSPASRGGLDRVHDYIEHHLGDPALTPTMIASHHRISLRHLYRLFDEVGDTVAAFIRRRRLIRCKAALADALQADRSITEIASACGFNDVTTFGRAFRSAFGVTPRDYRRSVRNTNSTLGRLIGSR